MPFKPGQVIGDYRVESFLGKGAMGEVFRARHLESQALVAIKTFEAADDDPELRLRFEREAQAMARVGQHPHVLQAYGLIEAQGHLILVLELATGGDLMSRLRTARPADEELRAWIRALSAGAAHLHAAGIVHRDIKPQNVLFDAAGNPKLGDFGLARLADAQSLTVSGHMLGTPAYMPPEQIRTAKEVGPAADVYALGALLFRCLTRQPVFQGDSLAATLAMILREAPRDPRELEPDAPPDLAALCLRMLAKDPADRPSAEEVLATLDTEAPDAGAATPPRRALWLGGVAVVAALSLGLGAAARWGRPAPPPPPPLASPEPSPEPTRLASPVPTAPHPVVELTPSARELDGAYRVRCLDAEWAIVMTGDRLAKIPLAGGKPRFLDWQLPDSNEDWLHDLAVARRGGRFAVASANGRAWVWRDGVDGEPREVERRLVNRPRLAFSPDGSRLATRDPSSILVFGGDGREVVWEHPYDPTFRMWLGFRDADTLFTATTTTLTSQATVLQRWDLPEGEGRAGWRLGGIVSCLRVDPVHGRVAVGTGLGTIGVLSGEALTLLEPPGAESDLSLGSFVPGVGRPVHACAVRDLVFAGQQLLSLASSSRFKGDEIFEVRKKPSQAAWDLRTHRRLHHATRPFEHERYGFDWIPGTRFVIETAGSRVFWEELPYPEAEENLDGR